MVALALLCMAGCAEETYPPDIAPEYVATRGGVAFYKLGPLQTAPPDERLDADERVRMLRREMGYSLVLLPDGQTGYVANEDLAPAPPEPPLWKTSHKHRSASSEPTPAETHRPKPNFGATPTDAPSQ
jgi:hypothetical protein